MKKCDRKKYQGMQTTKTEFKETKGKYLEIHNTQV